MTSASNRSDSMIRKTYGEISYLEFELLQEFPNLRHAVFLRHGGVSQGAFQSLNVGGGTGDSPDFIEENRKKIREVLSLSNIISLTQVHGVHLESIGKTPPQDCPCDGLSTAEKQLGLMIKHADCQAAIFYDPIHHVVANVHCGWRGNVQNIYEKTLLHMQKTYGSSPENLFVCISPSLGPSHAEFIHYQKELPSSFWYFQEKPCYFNLWEISRDQLLKLGILPHHIQLAELCTYAEEKDFFSYRREKITGRHATVAFLI